MTFVGRDDELRQLESAFEECVDGRGSVVILTGPVASGKTELLLRLGDHAIRSGALFVHASGSATEKAFPFGVLRQLVEAAPLRADALEAGRQLLEDGTFTPWLSDADPEAAGALAAQVLLGLCTSLLELAVDQPLVVAVDDMQDADNGSLEFLVHFIRRARSTRVLTVLSERERLQPPHPLVYAELVRQPRCRRIHLELLSQQEVTRMLRDEMGAPAVHQLASECYALSCGNPLLTRSLIDDYKSSVGTGVPVEQATTDLTVGDCFGQALLSCLHRVEPAMLRVAQAIAVLAQPASPTMIGRLLNTGYTTAAQAMDALQRAGLLCSGRFRHPGALVAVLRNMNPEERAELHRGAAQLLHSEGGSAREVANHIVASGHTSEPWVVPVLQNAAEQVLVDGQVELAVEYLRSAYRASVDARQRAAVKSDLLRAQWRANPVAAIRHLPELLNAAWEGRLHCRQSAALALYLLWYGRAEEAMELLERMCASVEEIDAEAVTEIQVAAEWAACVYPSLFDRARGVMEKATAPRSAVLRPPNMLAVALAKGADDPTVARAEQILQRFRLEESTLGIISAALLTLVYADRLDTTEPWCGKALDHADTRRMPAWQALFSAIQAEIVIRKGDLPSAEGFARAALARVPPEGWGVAVGLPLACMVLASTGMGRHEEAARHLAVPVPKAMFRSLVGVLYLSARGRHNLAIGRHYAALGDFQDSGELMERWGLDLPNLAPWRVDAAWACLQLGMLDQAKRLADEQGRRLEPGQTRVHGLTLRLRAATSDLRHRPVLLREAVNTLHACGDRLELARALADLGHAYQELGEVSRAHMTVRKAHHMAKACQAEPLLQALPPSGSDEPILPAGDDHQATGLSGAERRVASLAADGHTNKEIAGKLYITVSTVEQHLTRVYRKLGVNRRANLPTNLQPGMAGNA